MIKATVISRGKHANNNRMFTREMPANTQWRGNSHWSDVNVTWYNQSAAAGISLYTPDLLPPRQADVILFIDLPLDRKDIQQVKEQNSGAPLILLLKESPLFPYWFRPENHSDFAYVFTYNHKLVDHERYFELKLPKSFPPENGSPRNFSERKPVVLLNTNYYRGIKSFPTPLHYLKRLYTFRKRGWQFTFRDALATDQKLLYQERRNFAREALQKDSGILDIYGRGWEGQRYTWYYRFFPDKPYVDYPAFFEGEKLELLSSYRFVFAYENYRGDVGYISEKMFDAFYAGAVPIYLGDENITNHVPKECFVDARDFKNLKSIAEYIQNCDEQTWLKKRKAIDDFIESDQIKPFLPDAHAEQIIRIIKKAVKKETITA